MKKIIINVVSVLLMLAVFFFLGRALFHNWAKISSYDFNFNLVTLGVASLIYVATFFVLAFGWYLVLAYLHKPVPFYETLLYFCITQPAKYIPGKIWIAVARMRFCKNHGVPNSITLLSTGIEAVMEIFAGAYISVVAILQTDILGKFSFWGTLVTSAIGIILLFPPVFYFLINIYLKIVKKPHIERHQWVSFSKLLLLQVVYIASMFGFGFAQFFFLQSFAPVDMSHLPFILSIGGFSYVLSMLALFAPSGLGVREGIWYLAMKPISAPHVALIFSFVSRIWIIIVEAILLLICMPLLWVHRHNLHKMPEAMAGYEVGDK